MEGLTALSKVSFYNFILNKTKQKVEVAWDVCCRSQFSRQLNPSVLKSPEFFYPAEQKKSLCSWGKGRLGFAYLFSLWGTPVPKHSSHPGHAPVLKPALGFPQPPAPNVRKKTGEEIKLNKGSTIERVPNTQDKFSRLNKHFPSKGQQSE